MHPDYRLTFWSVLLLFSSVCLSVCRNVCLWSVLLPAEDRLLCSFKCFEKEGGAASVAHCSAGNTLVAGAAKGGQILVFSLTTMQLVKRIDTAKSARIHRLTYDPMADMLLCGSADGAFRVSQQRSCRRSCRV